MFGRFRRIKEKERNLIYQIEKEQQKAGLNFIQKPSIKVIIVLFCLIADMCTLYTVFELELTQQVSMVRASTAVAAIALDISPVLLAISLNDRNDKSIMKWILNIFYLFVFLLMFLSTFKLRYESRYNLFDKNNIFEEKEIASENETEIKNDSEENQKTTKSQDICAVILGILPFATSVVCFGVTYVKDSDEKRKQKMRLQKIELNHKKNEYQVMADEMKNELEKNDLEKEDEARYKVMKQQIEQYRNMLKIHVRRRLAEKEKTPQAITLLLEKDNEFTN